eukprot:scaffold21676_cov60-Phaeocystis_antarctica.AAC.5
MLQHVHSHVDGDVSVAALRMPAEAEPFVAAILAICAPPLVGHSARPLALPSASADGAAAGASSASGGWLSQRQRSPHTGCPKLWPISPEPAMHGHFCAFNIQARRQPISWTTARGRS